MSTKSPHYTEVLLDISKSLAVQARLVGPFAVINTVSGLVACKRMNEVEEDTWDFFLTFTRRDVDFLQAAVQETLDAKTQACPSLRFLQSRFVSCCLEQVTCSSIVPGG
eukprot:3344594-Amphidinium_carterae.1